VDMEGDCAHCWSNGVDGVVGTLQNCQRKQVCRVTLDRSHQTPMIGMCSLSSCCCHHRGTGVVGSDKNNRSIGEPCLLADLEMQSSRKSPERTLGIIWDGMTTLTIRDHMIDYNCRTCALHNKFPYWACPNTEFQVSARFKLRSTGLSSEISSLGLAERRSPDILFRTRRETVTGLLVGLPQPTASVGITEHRCS
jgi:hypothetical protein